MSLAHATDMDPEAQLQPQLQEPVKSELVASCTSAHSVQEYRASAGLLTAETDGCDKPHKPHQDRIMFSAWRYYGLEQEGFVNIHMLRLGSCEGTSSVQLLSQDVNNVGIIGVDERLTFGAGQSEVDFRIKLVTDGYWENTESFKVILKDPEGAELGPLAKAHITIADDDTYPRNDCALPCSISKLTRGFIHNQLHLRGMKFYQTAAALAYLGLFGVADSLILKLVIDNALGKGNETEYTNSDLSLALAFGYLALFILSHYCDVLQQDKRGRSGTRKWLRGSLVKKFLNLSTRGVDGLSDGVFINTVIFQVEQLVVDGWYQFLLCIKYVVLLTSNLAFQCYIVQGKFPWWVVLLIFLLLPPTMVVILMCRESTQTRLIDERQEAEDSWVDDLHGLVAGRHSIIGFSAVGKSSKRFKVKYEEFYNKHRKARFYQQTSKWIPRWIMSSVLFLMYAFAPTIVERYNLSAGDFAALVKSWLAARKGIESIYFALLTLQRSNVALTKIAEILNRETRVHERYARVKCMGKDAECQIQCTSSHEDVMASIMLEEIAFRNVAFHYRHAVDALGGSGISEPRNVLKRASVRIPCSGQLVWLQGDHGSGRRTVLRMIAGLLYATDGEVIVPPHKRVILVDRNPIVLEGTLLQNLRFGDIGQKKSLNDDACWALARKAGLSKHLLYNKEFLVRGPTDKDQFSTMDRTAIALTQAFVSQPGILCIDHLGDSMGTQWTEATLLPMLRAYCEGGVHALLRGEECAAEVQRLVFRPTVVWSSFDDMSGKADQVLQIRDQQLSRVEAASNS